MILCTHKASGKLRCTGGVVIQAQAAQAGVLLVRGAILLLGTARAKARYRWWMLLLVHEWASRPGTRRLVRHCQPMLCYCCCHGHLAISTGPLLSLSLPHSLSLTHSLTRSLSPCISCSLSLNRYSISPYCPLTHPPLTLTRTCTSTRPPRKSRTQNTLSLHVPRL